ncbi:hypothetical protein ACVIIV_003110 [Bradyrhizobium sp. USDA 4354]
MWRRGAGLLLASVHIGQFNLRRPGITFEIKRSADVPAKVRIAFRVHCLCDYRRSAADHFDKVPKQQPTMN